MEKEKRGPGGPRFFLSAFLFRVFLVFRGQIIGLPKNTRIHRKEIRKQRNDGRKNRQFGKSPHSFIISLHTFSFFRLNAETHRYP